jgi:hypothetical protein
MSSISIALAVWAKMLSAALTLVDDGVLGSTITFISVVTETCDTNPRMAA